VLRARSSYANGPTLEATLRSLHGVSFRQVSRQVPSDSPRRWRDVKTVLGKSPRSPILRERSAEEISKATAVKMDNETLPDKSMSLLSFPLILFLFPSPSASPFPVTSRYFSHDGRRRPGRHNVCVSTRNGVYKSQSLRARYPTGKGTRGPRANTREKRRMVPLWPFLPSLFRPPWPPRDAASGASHLSATIVSALVHGYVSTTLFHFVIFVFRPIVACRSSSPLLASRHSRTPLHPLAASSRVVVAAALVFLASRSERAERFSAPTRRSTLVAF